ncbi:MAG: hypothetical protein COT17_03040 [Elusimicrobia bacterium CG08_land_8_20_14_0_20_51_18]|nr:MAG: hypothetical protein COT17_03040 [Elusimicrobia bacterium CG08_land_8_20_14_0_20_51_18]
MINFSTFWLKRISAASFLALGILCSICGPLNAQAETEKQQTAVKEQAELEKLYRELKKEKPYKDIEIHYMQKTVIQEQRGNDEYINHLVSELRKSLQKGKRWGVVRRVEGNLVEIDKGAVHKVRERDVYMVYDASGNYKSKMEVEAIADAISIGSSYGRKKAVEPGDTVKFRGQRKSLELGLIYGFNETARGEKYWGLGMIWQYNFRSSWGFEFAGTYLKGLCTSGSDEWEGVREQVDIPIYFGARKYFYYPFWFSPFIGLGGSYLKVDYTYVRWDNSYIIVDQDAMSSTRIAPYFVIGTQFSGEQFKIELGARYFYGPELNVKPKPIKVRPTIYCASISFAW